ncbi:glycoside hydrolase family 97 N-terminal domain-containing protein [Streptomyces sp. NPDC052107]|uniref:glycoside hydrolase family 97 N-terminal domain-containing protein n=1 Tax=Streptomyces sp. NPDC052107 TaxID=3155632 RepID=UPI0034493FE5
MAVALTRARTVAAALCAGLAATLLTTVPARAEQHEHVWAVSEAAHAPRARISLDDTTGTLTLSVPREGRTVVEPSSLGVVTEQADRSQGLHFVRRKDRTIRERYRAKSGKRLDRRVHMRETRLSFASVAGARLDLAVRASADGVAYRYVLPAGYGDVLGETSAFSLPPDASARPLARGFLEQVPAARDDTRVLAGRLGQEAVLARRSGDRWFLGGVYAGAARTAEVPLWIGPGRWLVETIRDGADGLVQDRRVVSGGDAFGVDITANGGFAGIACPWHPGITTCYR